MIELWSPSEPVPCEDETLRIGAVVLARLDSSRLARKALADVCGKPLLWYCIQRCRAVAPLESRIVVATSTRPLDDAIVDFARGEGLEVYRGDADDVAGRFLGAARAHSFDAVARINADCPLADPGLLSEGCTRMATGEFDIVTNLQPRTYPYGIVLELFRTEAFATGYARMSAPEHFEHVTKYFYETLDEHRFVNLARDGATDRTRSMLDYRLTVDTAEQLTRFRAFVAARRVDWAQVDYRDAVAFGGFA